MTRALRAAVLVLLAGVVGVAAAAAQGGRTFKDCPHCPEMLTVAPGTFLMGEGAQHRVTLVHRFAYSPARVSFRDWKACVLAAQCQALSVTGSASAEPVVQVSWLDVQQYLLWLSLETGAEYRLLSEAEWEYLARLPAAGFDAEGLEWTSDCWHESLTGAPPDGSSWDADGDCRHHVARGRRRGEPAATALTKRYRVLFTARDGALGFRVARTLRD